MATAKGRGGLAARPALISRHRALVLVLAVVLVGAVVLGASFLPFVRPAPDPVPRSADAIVVPSGDLGGRLPLALELVRAGVAPNLVVDGLPDLPETKELCRHSPDVAVVCLEPEPDSTRTEARAAGRLAAERGWRTLVVVTDPVHVHRARLLFGRCVSGSVAVVGTRAHPGAGFRAVLHEWLGTVDAEIRDRGC